MDQATFLSRRPSTVFLCESPIEKDLSFFSHSESIEFMSRLISFGVFSGDGGAFRSRCR